MSFLKSLKKAANSAVEVVSNAGELLSLDNIVDDCVENFENQTKKYILTCSQYITTEEATRLENEWMDHCNANYDHRAHEATGRRVPDNWRDGGKDLVEVRKRMLNRRLDEHRGKLFERIAVMFQDGAVRVDHTRTSVQRKVEEFQANAQSVLPLSEADLKALIAELSADLDKWVLEYYPEGIEKFKEDSMKCKSMSVYNDFVEVVIPQVKVELSKKNRQLIEAVQKVQNDSLQKVSGFKGEMENKLPLSPEDLNNLIAADVAEIWRQVDMLYPQGRDAFDRAGQAASGKSFVAEIQQSHEEVSREVLLLNQSAISLLDDCHQKGQDFCNELLGKHVPSLPLPTSELFGVIESSRDQLHSLIAERYHNSIEKFAQDSRRVKGSSLLESLLTNEFLVFSNQIRLENDVLTTRLTETATAAQQQLHHNFQAVETSLPLEASVLDEKVAIYKQQIASTIVDTYGNVEKFEKDSLSFASNITFTSLETEWETKKTAVTATNALLVEQLKQATQARITSQILQQMQEQCRIVLQQALEQERAANSLSCLSSSQTEELFATITQQAEAFIPK